MRSTLRFGACVCIWALAACSETREALPTATGTTGQMGLVERLNVARSVIERATGTEGSGVVAIGLRDQPGRGLSLRSAARRREVAQDVRASFPELQVRDGVDRVVTMVLREGDIVVPRRDTVTNTFITVELPSAEALASVLDHPNVEFVTPVMDVPAMAMTTSIPMPAARQSGEIGWHLDSISALSEWTSPGFQNADLVTFDTGYDPDHPDRAPFCSGPTNCRWQAFLNFTDHRVDNLCSSPSDVTDYDNPVTECWYESPKHGMGVASVANGPANSDYSAGILGHEDSYAQAGVIVLKVQYEDIGGNNRMIEDDFATAVQWVIDNQYTCLFVTTCNWVNIRVGLVAVGWPVSVGSFILLESKFWDLAAQDKVLVFASAGEENQWNIVATFDPVVAVGALRHFSLEPLAGSPQGPDLALTAPGQQIFTNTSADMSINNATSNINGTSPAVGIAAGAAWFFLLDNESAYPQANYLKNRMFASARTDLLGTASPPTDEYGWGMVDLECLMDKNPFCSGPGGGGGSGPPLVAQISGPNEVGSKGV